MRNDQYLDEEQIVFQMVEPGQAEESQATERLPNLDPHRILQLQLVLHDFADPSRQDTQFMRRSAAFRHA